MLWRQEVYFWVSKHTCGRKPRHPHSSLLKKFPDSPESWLRSVRPRFRKWSARWRTEGETWAQWGPTPLTQQRESQAQRLRHPQRSFRKRRCLISLFAEPQAAWTLLTGSQRAVSSVSISPADAEANPLGQWGAPSCVRTPSLPNGKKKKRTIRTVTAFKHYCRIIQNGVTLWTSKVLEKYLRPTLLPIKGCLRGSSYEFSGS